MSALGGVWIVARRELGAYFHAPIAYAVGVLFLIVQGFSFWAVLQVLSDPAQTAPYGAVLESHFGGTSLYWATLFFLIAVISMRLVAEEKRQGTWEALLTTPLGEGAIIVGKWLGAFAFYLALWTPTALYLVVLRGYAPPGASLDVGPVLSSYLGVAVQGAAFLAVGLAASAATRNQIIAAVVTFVALVALFVVGEIEELAPSWLADAPGLASTFDRLDLREQMQRFASGVVDSGTLVFYAAVTVTALSVAMAMVALGRRRRTEVQGRLIAALLVAVIAGLVCVLGWRHSRTWDVTAARVHTLDAGTERVLAGVEEPVEMLVIRPGLESFEPVYRQLDRLLDRMTDAQPLLHRRNLDPALEPERARAMAAEFAVSLDDLIDGGAVLFQVDGRRRAVDILDMASFDRDDLGVGAMSSFRAEEAIASALAELTDADRPVLCATRGHGELPMKPAERPGEASWAGLARRAERDGARIEEIGRAAVVPSYCRVLVVAGPRSPLGADEALAVADYLRSGGSLLLATRTEISSDAEAPFVLPATGLELVLADYGVRLPAAIAVDPDAALELPLAWRTLDGYGDHPITAAFRGRRVTVWQRPRAVTEDAADADAARSAIRGAVLVQTSASGWAETSLATLLSGARFDAGDLPGPVSIAVAAWSEPGPAAASGDSAAPRDGEARLVVIGSALSLSSDFAGRGLGANDLFGASAIEWLSRRTRSVAVGDKAPEHLRLLMTDAQRRGAFATVVVAIPLLLGLLGAVVWRMRRRGE